MYLNKKIEISESQKTELEEFAKKNNELHDLIMEMYDDLSKGLKKLNINYILYAGSALGAHLYKDFIPWDDDLDLAILNKDRSKFINEIESVLPKKYKLVCPEKDKKWSWSFMKIINKELPLKYQKYTRKEFHYLWIDVTSLAPIKANSQKRKGWSSFSTLYGHFINIKNQNQGKIINALKYPLNLITTKFAIKKLLNAMNKHEGTDYMMEVNQLRKYYDSYINFDNLKFIEFRGRKVPVPNDIENYLKLNFRRNFYTIPENLRTHDVEVIKAKLK